jgi:hypothetical protein
VAVACDSRLKDAQVIHGCTDMTLYSVIEILLKADRGLAWRTNSSEGLTPLHKAFENGNIEVALWILHIISQIFSSSLASSKREE